MPGGTAERQRGRPRDASSRGGRSLLCVGETSLGVVEMGASTGNREPPSRHARCKQPVPNQGEQSRDGFPGGAAPKPSVMLFVLPVGPPH